MIGRRHKRFCASERRACLQHHGRQQAYPPAPRVQVGAVCKQANPDEDRSSPQASGCRRFSRWRAGDALLLHEWKHPARHDRVQAGALPSGGMHNCMCRDLWLPSSVMCATRSRTSRSLLKQEDLTAMVTRLIMSVSLPATGRYSHRRQLLHQPPHPQGGLTQWGITWRGGVYGPARALH